ncbi:50S ribosomal protein L19 [Candidatus Nomurabacteria bacterium RIFCSPLOWO2_01_FULL_33_24]|uniref:50S ribosomal protein L19 n=1 Tax=Candidatus Nomurabacteria bacterium RIFCSPLOWO2_01_FULL_33_24 TaxID=1801765 RepID=A0A1F6X1S2_9BACT|nr:MAG: 50S ribosomal protein L19 [Candidatus Nomurabacteria bacterium RIFCSPLOWO2_01_FULL_33_24]
MKTTTIKFSPVDIEKRKKLDIRSGDTIKVWSKIEEKGKTRLQAFEGLVLARKHGTESGATFTVRRIASGIGVEKVFPLYSPMIDKVEIVKRAKTRRSKLYYIREKAAKEIRKKMRSLAFSSQEIESEIGEPKNDDKLIDQEEAKIENKEKTLSETENLEVAK